MIIWLASYPRSGNTYFRVLLKHYFGIDTFSIYDDRLFAERHDIAKIVGHRPRSIQLSDMVNSSDKYFVKTHDFPVDKLPAIYLVRDGRDALVSYAHYILSFEKSDSAQFSEEAFRHILHDLIVYNRSFGGWGPNVLAWIGRSAPTAVVKFEDLIGSREPLKIVRQTLNLLGYPADFSIDTSEPPTFDELHSRMPNFFREGKTGSWREELPPDLLELFWEKHGDAMRSLGYEK